MKNLIKQINISEHDFIVTPEMYIGLKYIEVDLSKTIDSFETIIGHGTNLLTMFPVVVNEYYFFNQIRVSIISPATETSFMYKKLDNYDYRVYSPLEAIDSVPANFYRKCYGVFDVFIKGFAESSDYFGTDVYGIKVSTS